MKTLKFLFLAVLTIGLSTSCGGDDDAAPTRFELNNANLAGTYNLTFFEVATRETEDVNGTDIITNITIEGSTFSNAQFVFNSNGNYTTSGRYVENTETRVQGGTPRTETEIVDLDIDGTYQLNDMNSMMTITVDGDLISGRVSNFTENGFTVIFTVNETEPDFSSTSTIEYRFTRA